MQIFKSLNCCLCKVPFVPSAKDPKSPFQYKCGVVVCFDCSQAEKLSEADKKHHCPLMDDCQISESAAFFLIDILSNDALSISEKWNGYVLVKPIVLPECPICHEEYSLEKPERIPISLLCNHLLCYECFHQKASIHYEDPQRLECKCPLCSISFCYLETFENFENGFKAFLEELPKMKKQLDEGKGMEISCEECGEQFPTPQMFHCGNCVKKICGSCSFRRHRTHIVVDLEAEEIQNLLVFTGKAIDSQFNAYRQILPDLHKEIMENVSLLQIGMKEKLTLLEKCEFDTVRERLSDYSSVGDRFESFAEEYLPHLRVINTRVLALLKEQGLEETKTKTENLLAESSKAEVERSDQFEQEAFQQEISQDGFSGDRHHVKELKIRVFSEAQAKVREATSNDPCAPSTALMSEIANLTENPVALTEIMNTIWKRLKYYGKNWRKVYKSLLLLDFLIKCGNEKIAQQCQENIYSIEMLKDFQHVENYRDQGLHIRQEAKQIAALLADEERLKNEQNKFRQNGLGSGFEWDARHYMQSTNRAFMPIPSQTVSQTSTLQTFEPTQINVHHGLPSSGFYDTPYHRTSEKQ